MATGREVTDSQAILKIFLKSSLAPRILTSHCSTKHRIRRQRVCLVPSILTVRLSHLIILS